MSNVSSIKEIQLPQKPCNVVSLGYEDKFLIGTYELVKPSEHLNCDNEDTAPQDEFLNLRLGKLLIVASEDDLSSSRIVFDYDCKLGGGVFDLKVEFSECPQFTAFVAHSNGTIGIYGISLNEPIVLQLDEHIRVADSRTLLTSIDFLPSRAQRAKNHLVVGDSSGNIILVDSSRRLERIKVLDTSDSIWTVKLARFNWAPHCDLIFVGAEDSSWYIFSVSWRQEAIVTNLIYKNSCDFSAGVTSILISSKLALSVGSRLSVAIGSYDESIKFYELQVAPDAADALTISNVKQMYKTSICDGGIWRMKMASDENRLLLVAAMYAGSYALDIDPQTLLPTECANVVARGCKIDLGQPERASPSLDYGVDLTKDKRTICIVDFNNNLCILKRVDIFAS